MKKIIKINLIFMLILVLALPLFGKEKKVVNFQMVTQIPASNNSEIVTLESSGDTLLNESFEGTVTGWTYIDNDADGYHWGIYSEQAPPDTVAHTGVKGVGVYFNSSGNDDWFITPRIGIPTGTTVSFSFWAHSYSSSFLEDFNVKLSTSGTSISDFTVRLDSVTDVPNAWTKYTYDLSSYAGDSINLAVQCVSIDEWYLYADDFLLIAEGSVGNTITSTTTGGIWDEATTWIGGVIPTATDNVVIDGTVKTLDSYIDLECNNITINSGDSLYCDRYGSYGVLLNIGGDLINNGTITQSDLYWNFGLSVKGNITNNGEFSNKYITLDGESAQTITASHKIEIRTIEMKNGQNLIAGSDLVIADSHLLFNNGEFVIGESKTVSLYRTKDDVYSWTVIEKAHILGGGTVYCEYNFADESTSTFPYLGGYSFEDSTTVENVTLTGTITAFEDFRILSNVINRDTLQGFGHQYGDAIIVEEDFVNDGVVRELLGGYGNSKLTMYVRKNVVNKGRWENDWVAMDGTSDQSFTNEGELASSFEFRTNVSSATTFQWYKDGVAIDGATSEYYQYYYVSYNPQNYDPYGEYYCQTDAGNSRTITLNDSSATIVAGFYATPTTGTAPLGVTFTDTSNGIATSWNWHFGDGDSSSSNNPSHTYTTAGNYSVSLTVSDGTNESTETKNSYITVAEVVEDSSNWTTLHPTPTSNTIEDVQFVNSSIGYACGTKGTLIKTIDGGD
nr:choice-of-anchor J domain-containing protein [Candidatus Neomarinimicrobiota bacterium]